MNSESEHQELGRLQHEAEHVRPKSRSNVMIYLVILFGAAFLLMVMTYFMQQRSNAETIDTLKQSMTDMTSIKSIEELQEENSALQTQVDELKKQAAAAESTLNAAQSQLERQQASLDALQTQYQALSCLNEVRALYNQHKNAAAREAVSAAEAQLSPYGGMEAVLSGISADMTEEQKTVYDPLDAYQTILGWLEQ